jgi:hypothetical protein
VDLFPGLLANVLERLLQKHMLDDDFLLPQHVVAGADLVEGRRRKAR